MSTLTPSLAGLERLVGPEGRFSRWESRRAAALSRPLAP